MYTVYILYTDGSRFRVPQYFDTKWGAMRMAKQHCNNAGKEWRTKYLPDTPDVAAVFVYCGKDTGTLLTTLYPGPA